MTQAGGLETALTQQLCDQLSRALPNAHPATVRNLSRHVRVTSAARGQEIFRQGQRFPLTLILEGFAAYQRTTVDGRQLLLAIVEAGTLFGFVGLASRLTTGDLFALTNVTVGQWPGSVARRLLTRDPGLAVDVIDNLADGLVRATERLDGYLYQDARQRVVRVLGRHRDLFFDETPILHRGHLSSLVGTSRQMTGRVLRELEREGVLQRTGRHGLQLLSPDALDADATGEVSAKGHSEEPAAEVRTVDEIPLLPASHSTTATAPGDPRGDVRVVDRTALHKR